MIRRLYIIISIDGKPVDVIEYIDGKKNSPKACALVLKWVEQEICTIKTWEKISPKHIKVTSTKGSTYDIKFTNVGFMNESDLTN